jgi:hypothetical protein
MELYAYHTFHMQNNVKLKMTSVKFRITFVPFYLSSEYYGGSTFLREHSMQYLELHVYRANKFGAAVAQ